MTDLYDKNIASFYNDVAKDYDKVYSSDVERAENEILADYLSQIIRPDDRVLDVGTGTGLLLDLVDIPKDNFFGIDISSKMIDQARELFPKNKFEVLNNTHSFPPTSHKVDFQEVYEFMDERLANEEVNHVFLHGFSYESLNHLNPSSVRICSEYIKDSMDDYEQSKYVVFYSNFIKNKR